MAYTALADVKTRIGGSGSTTKPDDTILTALIADAKAVIDRKTGRTFEAESATKTFDAQRMCDGGDISDDGRTLWLRGLELLTVSGLTNGDGTTISASDYVLEPRQYTPYHAITLKRSASVAWTWTTSPENAISVAGTWGFSATAPGDVVEACIRLVTYWYKQREQGGGAEQVRVSPDGTRTYPSRMPRDVLDLIEPLMRTV